MREIEKRALVLGKVSNTLSAKAAYIVEKSINRDVGSVVFLMKEELECVSSARDFISLINERKKLENC